MTFHIESPPKLNNDINTSQEIEDPPSFDSQTTVMTESVRKTAQIEIEKNIQIPIADVQMPVEEDCKSDSAHKEDKTEEKNVSQSVETTQTEIDKNPIIQEPIHRPIQKDKEEVKFLLNFDTKKRQSCNLQKGTRFSSSTRFRSN